ncbi:septum site-determining protein MinC [Bisgaardia hudsonensis]|uniref:Probable septum site-determining protein MinC n=1 Tax=Bisgaardia hudsonensis TaxID=109472 RepID=A0A4R2N163_9PAST|nr:septum site-determining protein MinC [Bisgaardia hudsonensis]QLB13126.1 septum site-determining protein MinC [Bisgaardia hudsonensis]TCP13302.1 septum site-determining protein MinC [Bisgaardia hudsonensis]
MSQDIIELRTGQFSSIFLVFKSANLTIIKRALARKVKKSPTFFHNISVILKFDDILQKIDLVALKKLLAEFNIQVVGISDWQNSLQKELILSSGFLLLGKSEELGEVIPEPNYLPTKVIEGNVVKGQVIFAKNSDLIIHGNVESGAEVAATGNIHIYGKLKGRAMSGVNTNIGCLYVQHLDAEFISVNSRCLYKDNIPTEFLKRAVRIFAEKNQLEIRILGEY